MAMMTSSDGRQYFIPDEVAAAQAVPAGAKPAPASPQKLPLRCGDLP